MINKELLKKQFEKSLNSYNDSAVVQKEMAEFLNTQIQSLSLKPSHILEIGCGSGILSEKVFKLFSSSTYLCNDICDCETYIKRINPKIEFLQADAEKINIPDRKFDLILSSAVFQWIKNPKAFFLKLSKLLKPKGFLIFSSFGPKNFLEIKTISGIGLEYFNLEQYNNLLKNYFHVLSSFEELKVLNFSSTIEILRHIKNTGVNSISDKPFSISFLKNFDKEYKKQFSQNEKLSLSYHPLYFICQKEA